MAKLEAVIDANVSPFQAALKVAVGDADKFASKMTDIGNNLLKSISGIDVSKAMGIGIAVYAAQKLGDALVGAARKGLESFEAYERAVLRFKYVLPTGPGGGAAAAGRAEEIATMAGAKSGIYSAEQMRNAALYLAEASRELRESPEKLNDMLDTLKAFAIKTESTPEQIAEAYRRLVVGIKEEGGMAVGKFFKSTPGMEAEVEKLRDAHAEAYLHAQGLGDASQASAAQASEYHRLQTQSVSDFMSEETSRKGASAVLVEIKEILERSAPKGIIAETEAAEPGVMLAKAWGGVAKAFGEQLKPAIDDFTRMLIDNMPEIKRVMQGLGASFSIAIEGIMPILKGFGKAIELLLIPLSGLKAALDQINGNALANAEALSAHVDEVIAAKKAEKEAREKAAVGTKKEAPAPETKEEIKSAEEVAKIQARADAAHEESQERISFEMAQANLRSMTQAAARAALIDRPRGATEALDKQYAAEAEAAAKIINIKAEAQGKINAAEIEITKQMGKIDEEQALRNIERETANAMDDGARKREILARLNAEDAAAQLARNDVMSEAREKEREADMDAANKIIDAQEEAAAKTIDAQKSAALAALDKLKPPKEEEPAQWETFSKFVKGAVVEGSADKKAREQRNADAAADFKREQEIRRVGIEREFDRRKQAAEDHLEVQRPTLIGLKRTHQIQQEEHVKAIEAEKGRTEADVDFAKAHGELALPGEPKEEAKGKADVSRKILAEILTKLFEGQKVQIKEFEEVFMKA